MKRRVPLRKLARGREDTGDPSRLSLLAFNLRDYQRIKAQITPERVNAELADVLWGAIRREDIDRLQAFNFVVTPSPEEEEGGPGARRQTGLWKRRLLSMAVEIDD